MGLLDNDLLILNKTSLLPVNHCCMIVRTSIHSLLTPFIHLRGLSFTYTSISSLSYWIAWIVVHGLYMFWGWQYWSVTLWTVFVSLCPKWVMASIEWTFSFDIEESCTLFPIRCSLNFSWGFMGWFLSFLGKSKVWCCLFLSCKMNSGKSMPPVDNERKWATHVPHFWAVLGPITASYNNN